MADPLLDTELDAAEALRWCARHHADLRFDFADGRRVTEVVLVVPLRQPAGDTKRYEAIVHLQGRAPDVVVGLVARARGELNLE